MTGVLVWYGLALVAGFCGGVLALLAAATLARLVP